MKRNEMEFSAKKACDGVTPTADIEAGDSISREKSRCDMDLLQSYLPCIFQATTLSLTEGTENSNFRQCGAKSDFIVAVSKSESFHEGSKPPPLVLPGTSSETEEEDEMDKSISENYAQTDPFASREGKTLCWRNVNMTLVSFSQRNRAILCFGTKCALFHNTRLEFAKSLTV
jgi:hypothetical protein